MSNTSLLRRAPSKPIPRRAWLMFLDLNRAELHYENVLEQVNLCIRSQLGYSSAGSKIKWSSDQQGLEASFGNNKHNASGFPYPKAFLNALDEYGLPHPGYVPPVQQNTQLPAGALQYQNVQPPMDDDCRSRGPLAKTGADFEAGFSNRLFGITYHTTTESEYHLQPIYLVIGIFPKGHANPREKIVFITNPEKLFSRLHWACDFERGTHKPVTLDSNGVADLRLLLDAYNYWRTPENTAPIWADWIHQVLNNSSHDVHNGLYSLEIVLGWSAKRISAVVLLPILLSLALGIWLNSRNWSDLATIQTAWGTASYIATAGGLSAALLGILSSIADG
ncbi:hypothetical protein Daesc_005753 [Daldinia eschscholtzii]|uniref:Uncharacterized protein n=1 Tax=Daldinia eschscholtzii TaxID=292717 RepID=A0AAX6MLE5_9PEZI